MNSCRKNFIVSSVISLIVGALIFIYIYGTQVINPFNVDCIYSLISDVPMYQSSWLMFRDAPWSFPIGIYDGLSYPDKVSILWSDCIYNFAIFFKLLSPVLPEDFQYFGIFGLTNYMLQSFFGMLIVRKFCSKDIFGNLTAFLAVAFVALFHM